MNQPTRIQAVTGLQISAYYNYLYLYTREINKKSPSTNKVSLIAGGEFTGLQASKPC